VYGTQLVQLPRNEPSGHQGTAHCISQKLHPVHLVSAHSPRLVPIPAREFLVLCYTQNSRHLLQQATMAHDTVWYSRPRTYGKGSRSWYVVDPQTIDDMMELTI
jgi:hypothetical protein